MRIAYCTNVRLPSERAHGHQIAQVCDALVRLGHDVTVVAPYRRNVVDADYWTYYGADRRVKVLYHGYFDPIYSGFTPGVIGLLTMNWMLRRQIRRALKPTDYDLLYTRTPALLPALLATGISVVLELHQLPRLWRRRFVLRCNRCKVVACLTSAMRDALIALGVDAKRVIVEGDAVDLRRFEKIPGKEMARKRFGVTTDRVVVGYVGRLKTLGMDKGVFIMLKAFRELQKEHRFFGFIVGGPSDDQKAYEEEARALGLGSSDVLFTGEIPAKDVPMALAACDVLAMPFPDFPHYRHHMSPLKMFEYMAAERPLVTSDLPTVRDVLDESTAIFCKPGDVESFAQALEWIVEHPAEAGTRAKKARELVKRHTWEERMKRILRDA